MKKSVLIISGSPRPKGNTWKILRLVEQELARRGEVTIEYRSLAKVKIEGCRGCLKCMRRHERQCPHHDDLLSLRDSMLAADGVIFACPVYVHTVTALMKNFYDRLAFQCHQPAYYEKSALLLTTTELSGAKETLDYMRFVAFTWGFRIADELDVVSPSFTSNGRYREERERRVAEAAQRFWTALSTPRPAPSLKELAFFHLMRTKVTFHREVFARDYEYWRERGWLDKDYYEDLPASRLKSLVARRLVKIRAKSMMKKAGVDPAALDSAPPSPPQVRSERALER